MGRRGRTGCDGEDASDGLREERRQPGGLEPEMISSLAGTATAGGCRLGVVLSATGSRSGFGRRAQESREMGKRFT